MRDHVLMFALSKNVFTATFHWWTISCHLNVQSVPGRGPTIDLHAFREWMLRRSKCRLHIARCSPAKRAFDDARNRQYRKRVTMAAWKAFDAWWRWCCKSAFSTHVSQHATQPLCPPSRGKTLRNTPAVDDHCLLQVYKQTNPIQLLNQRVQEITWFHTRVRKNLNVVSNT